MGRIAVPALASALVVGLGLTSCGQSSNAQNDAGPSSDEGAGGTGSPSFSATALQEDIEFLASPELDGRLPGTDGDDRARAYLVNRFSQLQLEALGDAGDFEQRFTDADGRETANILALLPGQDDEVADEVVLLSAHHDHLGDGHLGANDDASGVATVLAIAEAMAESEGTRRSVLFALFGAEESGFEGSEHFMTNLPGDLEEADIVYNLNLDMVGSYTASGVLHALGTLPGTVGADVVARVAERQPDLQVSLGDSSEESDNVTFCARGIPYVFFWTDDEACYHQTCDTADRIDDVHLAQIAGLVHDVTVELADSAEDLAENVRPGADVCTRP